MALALGINANAQIVLSNDYGQSETSVLSEDSNSNKIEQRQGGADFQYHAIEDGWGIGIDYVIKYYVLGYNILGGKTNDIISHNLGGEIYLGGNYRYHFTKNLYIEGRVLAGYYYWNIQYKNSIMKEQNKNKVFMGFSPRIGLQFGSWGISAGYRWDYLDFKFDKDNCLDRLTIGLSFGI